MARDLSTKEKIVPVYIEEEMKASYLSYSMSVIVGRALPDVRDGLKPVHRRVLYAMEELSLAHNKPLPWSLLLGRGLNRLLGERLGWWFGHGFLPMIDDRFNFAIAHETSLDTLR